MGNELATHVRVAIKPNIFIGLIIYDINFNVAFYIIDIIAFIVFSILIIQFLFIYLFVFRVRNAPSHRRIQYQLKTVAVSIGFDFLYVF